MIWNKVKNGLFQPKTSTTKITTKAIGDVGEALARAHLETQGLVFFAENFHHRGGEIDIIMRDREYWVFVEVKYRKNANYGEAFEAVSYKKQNKIKLCAGYFLQQHGLNEYNTACRFDIVGLTGAIENPKISWLKNAF